MKKLLADKTELFLKLQILIFETRCAYTRCDAVDPVTTNFKFHIRQKNEITIHLPPDSCINTVRCINILVKAT